MCFLQTVKAKEQIKYQSASKQKNGFPERRCEENVGEKKKEKKKNKQRNKKTTITVPGNL